ncbi:hypothetical protein, partial [Zavarzinella formosa]|uniref:hypothetical protein n=1 Tax=Zavarzinella formosa TaxID=360055 RepID=UPI00187DB7D0
MRSTTTFQSNYRHVRRVKDRWQARVWDGSIRSHINLGLWVEERAAREAVRLFFDRTEIPPQVQPRFVRASAGGGYVGRIRGRRIPPPGEDAF